MPGIKLCDWVIPLPLLDNLVSVSDRIISQTSILLLTPSLGFNQILLLRENQPSISIILHAWI